MQRNSLVMIVGALSMVFATMLVLNQTTLRQDGNDPQIQLAEDAAAQLKAGSSSDSVVGSQVDMRTSLQSFMNVYNASGKPLAGGGYIDNHIAHFPLGALQAAQGKDHYLITWQPDPQVREAAVVAKAGDRYVVAARSLREVERRKDVDSVLIIGGWVVTLLGVLAYYAVFVPTSSKKK